MIEQLINYMSSGSLSAIDLIAAASLSGIGLLLIILGIIFLLAWLAVTIGGFAIWVWMLVDCVQRVFPNKNEKAIWLTILIASIFGAGILLHVAASLVYCFTVKKTRGFLGCRKCFAFSSIRQRERIPLKREKKIRN